MSRRNSGYQLTPNELYSTPPWVTRTIADIVPRNHHIWEPACGLGLMAGELKRLGYRVTASDLDKGKNFFSCKPPKSFISIVTNPPFKQSQAFIERALHLTKPTVGMVAMLLPSDYDHAKERRHLFADHPAFCTAVVLTKRIKWFDGPKGPSENHKWFIWNWRNHSPPVIVYPICEQDDYIPPAGPNGMHRPHWLID